MNHKRIGLGCAVVNRLLYAIGGFDGRERLTSCECYHPENNEWSLIRPMKCARSGAGVAALGQFIYVVGGFNGKQQLASVERFDTEKQDWDFVAPIRIARSALSLTALDGKLYAMGGFDGASIVTIVEVYDPITDTWTEGVPLTSGRSGHAAAVIYQPSTISDSQECSFQDNSARDNGSSGTGKPPSGYTAGQGQGSGVGSRSGMFGGGGGGVGARDSSLVIATCNSGICTKPKQTQHCHRGECRLSKQLISLRNRLRPRRCSDRENQPFNPELHPVVSPERKNSNPVNRSPKLNLKRVFSHLFVSFPSKRHSKLSDFIS